MPAHRIGVSQGYGDAVGGDIAGDGHYRRVTARRREHEGRRGKRAIEIDVQAHPVAALAAGADWERHAEYRIGHECESVCVLFRSAGLLLRTTKKAIYSMVERAQLPGIVRIGRRVLIREDALLHWLRQKSSPTPEG